jgi:HlyD family secretion protein
MRREAELFQQSNSLRNTRLAMEQYQLQLSQQLAEIENQLQQQKRVFERYEELARDSLISRHEYELVKDQYEYLLKRKQMTVESQKSELNLRRTQVADLEDSLQRMQANLDVVKQKQENLTVKAPVSGQVTSLNAVAGQSKSPGERLGQIDQLDGFMVRSAVEEKYIALVDADTRGEAEINGNTYGLKVHKISPEVVDGKFEVEFYFRGDRPRGMKRGQSLQVRLELGETSEATLLPLGNFLAETGGKWVYVLDRSEKFALKRKVRLGQQNNQTIEVLDGLKPGDRVITSSYESFNGVEKLLLKSSSKPSAL